MEFEKRIGVIFHKKDLLETALTHSSYANQHKNMQYNEKLEFLGDAVLQLAITEYIYKNQYIIKINNVTHTNIHTRIFCNKFIL